MYSKINILNRLPAYKLYFISRNINPVIVQYDVSNPFLHFLLPAKQNINNNNARAVSQN